MAHDMADWETLRGQLGRLEGQSYKAYKLIRGRYDCGDFTLNIAHVQGDPFAAPSRVSLHVSHAIARFPEDWRTTPARRIALADYLHRQVQQGAKQIQQRRGSGKGGVLSVLSTSQAIVQRTAVHIHRDQIELRLGIGLPAYGRRIAGAEAIELLGDDLPALVERCLFYQPRSHQAIEAHLWAAEDAEVLRQQMVAQGLVAFVADGAILPRRSGVDERPLSGQSGIPFRAPATLRVTLTAPHAGVVTGLGIPAGITLIVGGGYHGKSTVLRAIEQGIYNHLPGDGREQVVTHPTAVKIRAEDGRSVVGVDISPFINDLPQGLSTEQFSTTNASGSTSQAASIIEAVEAGTQLLLIDEDTAATNFMIRDRNMQALIAKTKEPITPFIDKVRQLYDDHGVSTILVMGGSGDYFEVADTVIALDNYQPLDVTDQAKAIAKANPNHRTAEGGQQFGAITPRYLGLPNFQRDQASGSDSAPNQEDGRGERGGRSHRGHFRGRGRRDYAERGPRPPKIKVIETHTLSINRQDIDVRSVEQLIESGQLRAVAQAILYSQAQVLDQDLSLSELLDCVMQQVETAGLDGLTPYPMGDLVEFRRYELAAVINRLRQLKNI